MGFFNLYPLTFILENADLTARWFQFNPGATDMSDLTARTVAANGFL